MTASFTGRLQLDFGDWGADGRIAITLNDILWDDGRGFAMIIPAGTMSDGATVPRPLWWFLPPWGDRATWAAVLHDYLLERQAAGFPFVGAETRVRCDRQLYSALMACGVGAIRAWLVWLGVRAWSIIYGVFHHA